MRATREASGWSALVTRLLRALLCAAMLQACTGPGLEPPDDEGHSMVPGVPGSGDPGGGTGGTAAPPAAGTSGRPGPRLGGAGGAGGSGAGASGSGGTGAAGTDSSADAGFVDEDAGVLN